MFGRDHHLALSQLGAFPAIAGETIAAVGRILTCSLKKFLRKKKCFVSYRHFSDIDDDNSKSN